MNFYFAMAKHAAGYHLYSSAELQRHENSPPGHPGASSTEHVCLCLCNFTCAPTGLEGGALCRHAPRAGPAASGQHDRELVERVGLQTRHHVVQAGGVGQLGRDKHVLANKFCCFNHNYNYKMNYLLLC